MFIGISKNLGNGFRVGIGTNLSEKKKSQRELAKEADAEFIIKCRQRITSALLGYFHSHGVCVSSKDIDSCIDMPDFQDDLKVLEPVAARCGKRFALYNDTGKINQSGKEELLEGVYETESYLLSKRGSFDMARALKEWHRGRPANIYALKGLKIMLYPLTILFIVVAFMNTAGNNDSKITALVFFLLSLWIHFKSRKYKTYQAESSIALDGIKLKISEPQAVLNELK